MGSSGGAEITLDGTMGPTGAVSGPNYAITADLGRQIGANLFHSFGRFTVGTGESATFSGPASIANVIGRVTGGNPSSIDGLLRTDFPGGNPNLYLLNPSGILFGPNARLDVQGSFHTSTADFVRLADGVRFNANPSAQDAVLTSAPPAAFGFLGNQTTGISVQGSQLAVRSSKAISVVGGNVAITSGGILRAPGGVINLASHASDGELGLEQEEEALRHETSTGSGTVSISRGSAIDVSGSGAGSVFIRGGELVMTNNAVIAADTSGQNGGRVDIRADNIKLTDGAIIESTTSGEGQGNDLFVQTKNLELRNGGVIGAQTMDSGNNGSLRVQAESIVLRDGNLAVTGIFNQVHGRGRGNAGPLIIQANRLEIRNGAEVNTNTFGTGKGGELQVDAGEIVISRDESPYFTGIGAQTVSRRSGSDTASGGNITIHAHKLEITRHGEISTSTYGKGKGGNLSIQAGELVLSKDGALSTDAEKGSIGHAGNLTIRADKLTVSRGADISSATFGSGDGGEVQIIAGDILLSGEDATVSKDGFASTGIFVQAEPNSRGNGGNVSLQAGKLRLESGGEISARTFGQGKGGKLLIIADTLLLSGGNSSKSNGKQSPNTAITSEATSSSSNDAGDVLIETNLLEIDQEGAITVATSGPGEGGDLIINANEISLNNGSTISAISAGSTPNAGRSGKISIIARDKIKLAGGSRITGETAQADAGDIELNAQNLLHLRDSRISTSVADGQGDGGNIRIDPVFVVLENGQIMARAVRGRGGNITIQSDFFIASPDSVVDASSELGIHGTVDIRSPDTNISAKIIPLPEHFLNASALLSERCAARTLGEMGSFRVRSRHVPELPEGWLSSDYHWQHEALTNGPTLKTAASSVESAFTQTGPVRLAARAPGDIDCE
jgi:filamentous hemagglutinin family protein